MNAPAENYLCNEINHLAKKVEKLYVLATDAKKGCRLSVELPHNVRAYNVAEGRRQRILQIAVYFLKYFLKPVFLDMEDVDVDWKKKIKYAYFCGKSDYYYQCLNKKFVRKIEMRKDETIILYSFWFYTYAMAAVRLKESHFQNARIFARAHGYDLYSERNPFNYIPMREYLLREMDYVFPCSEHGGSYLRGKYKDYEHKIITSYLGSEDYGINSCSQKEKFTIVSCSRVEAVKRIDLLVQAMLWLEEHGFEGKVRWIHIGDGSQMKIVQQKAKQLLKNKRIIFTKAMDNVKVMEFYQKEDINLFVNVSESEGLPISIMEAASMGFPILATDVGGVSEIVDDRNGWLLSKDISAEELAQTIIEISQLSAWVLNEKGKASRKKWEQLFNIEHNVTKLLRKINYAQ